MSNAPKTLFQKIWDSHVVHQENGRALLYIDLHLVHEVTSPQAFEALRLTNRVVRRPELTLATMDHNVPTTNRSLPIVDEISAKQMQALSDNCAEFGVTLYDLNDIRQGIVHVIGPEQGTDAAGHDDCVRRFAHFDAWRVWRSGVWHRHVGSRARFGDADFAAAVAQDDGNSHRGRRRFAARRDFKRYYSGDYRQNRDGGRNRLRRRIYRSANSQLVDGRPHDDLQHEHRSGRARAGLIAPDETTFGYLQGRHFAPKAQDFEDAVENWRDLKTDEGATYDERIVLTQEELAPMVSWGTNPGQTLSITSNVPSPSDFENETDAKTCANSLDYMGLAGGAALENLAIDRVFIGSCTNGRIEDLRLAAHLCEGKQVKPGLHAMIVPGSGPVKQQAEAEGLDKIFVESGFDWREPGCSMCLGMNPDILQPGQRCASTSNRNFEGRQGKGGRTHLVSVPMAVAAAIEGKLVDVRRWDKEKFGK